MPLFDSVPPRFDDEEVSELGFDNESHELSTGTQSSKIDRLQMTLGGILAKRRNQHLDACAHRRTNNHQHPSIILSSSSSSSSLKHRRPLRRQSTPTTIMLDSSSSRMEQNSASDDFSFAGTESCSPSLLSSPTSVVAIDDRDEQLLAVMSEMQAAYRDKMQEAEIKLQQREDAIMSLEKALAHQTETVAGLRCVVSDLQDRIHRMEKEAEKLQKKNQGSGSENGSSTRRSSTRTKSPPDLGDSQHLMRKFSPVPENNTTSPASTPRRIMSARSLSPSRDEYPRSSKTMVKSKSMRNLNLNDCRGSSHSRRLRNIEHVRVSSMETVSEKHEQSTQPLEPRASTKKKEQEQQKGTRAIDGKNSEPKRNKTRRSKKLRNASLSEEEKSESDSNGGETTQTMTRGSRRSSLPKDVRRSSRRGRPKESSKLGTVRTSKSCVSLSTMAVTQEEEKEQESTSSKKSSANNRPGRSTQRTQGQRHSMQRSKSAPRGAVGRNGTEPIVSPRLSASLSMGTRKVERISDGSRDLYDQMENLITRISADL